MVLVTVVAPSSSLGDLMTMLQRRDGTQNDLSFVSGVDQVMMKYEMPWREVVLDLYDEVKSLSSGYASLEYEDVGFREGSFALSLFPLHPHTLFLKSHNYVNSKSSTCRYLNQSRTYRRVESSCIQGEGSI